MVLGRHWRFSCLYTCVFIQNFSLSSSSQRTNTFVYTLSVSVAVARMRDILMRVSIKTEISEKDCVYMYIFYTNTLQDLNSYMARFCINYEHNE